MESLEPEIQASAELLTTYVSDINYHITRHGFRIDKKMNESTGELIYLFVNTVSDEVIKSNTQYSSKELEVIKKLIDAFIDNVDFCLSRVESHQMVAQEMGRSLGDASLFVDSLVDNGWINSADDGKIVMSPRTISELKSYLMERFGSVSLGGKLYVCKQCGEIVTMGVYSKDLKEAFHWRCYTMFAPDGDVETIGVRPEIQG